MLEMICVGVDFGEFRGVSTNGRVEWLEESMKRYRLDLINWGAFRKFALARGQQLFERIFWMLP